MHHVRAVDDAHHARARPRKGEDARLEELMRKLTELAAEQEGCSASYLLRPHDDSREIARIAIYTNEAAAEQAAILLRHALAEPRAAYPDSRDA